MVPLSRERRPPVLQEPVAIGILPLVLKLSLGDGLLVSFLSSFFGGLGLSDLHAGGFRKLFGTGLSCCLDGLLLGVNLTFGSSDFASCSLLGSVSLLTELLDLLGGS